MTKANPPAAQSCSPFGTPADVWLCFFPLASSHHHPDMIFYHIFFLLLVVLSAYSESPQHAKPPDSPSSIAVTICPNSSTAQLGVLTHVLPQNEVEKIVLPQSEVLKSVVINSQLIIKVNAIMETLLNVKAKNFKFLNSTLMYGGEKLGWGIRNLLQSLQHAIKMYTWSLSENQVSIQFRCKLIALLLKQSLFRKHDFTAYLHKLYCSHQNMCFWHFRKHSNDRSNFHVPTSATDCKKSNKFQFYGGGKPLIFSFDELLPYVLTDLHEGQYQFLRCVKNNNKQNLVVNDGDICCNVPLTVLAPKLTLKTAKELAILHDMFMPSKILLKNAQILLANHKCDTCVNLQAVFRPYKVASNIERQHSWYQNNKEKRAEYNKQPHYQESHKKASQKHYWSTKDVKFPPNQPSTDLCQKIVSGFSADTAPEAFEEDGCAVCGKLTPVREMEELSDVENINLLKVDGVTRKARCKSSDPVRELRGPILAPDCSRVCPICVESLEKKKMPILALANGLWVGKIPDELKDLTYAEQLLIARVRHNRCIVKVSSGMFKMRANAISFSNPMPKIYNVLPPPIEEMDEVLAFI